MAHEPHMEQVIRAIKDVREDVGSVERYSPKLFGMLERVLEQLEMEKEGIMEFTMTTSGGYRLYWRDTGTTGRYELTVADRQGERVIAVNVSKEDVKRLAKAS